MNDIFAVVPTSPIPSHPSTALIEDTIFSIHAQLPHSQIFILMDGIREEMEFRREAYEKYKQKLIESNRPCCHPVSFAAPMQQAWMLRSLLITLAPEKIFLFCEHDAVLTGRIEWDRIANLLMERANIVRLYWNEVIHPEHTHLMHGELEPGFVKTTQFSGWPFLSRVGWFLNFLEKNIPAEDRVMIETPLYSVCVEAPWEAHKIVIYAPQPNAVRFIHRNGRVDLETGIRDPGNW